MQKRNGKIHILLTVLARRLKWILAVALVAAIALGAGTAVFGADTYRSTMSLYVVNSSLLSATQHVSDSGLSFSDAMAREYMALLKTDAVIDNVAAYLREQGYVMTNEAIGDTLTVRQVEHTALLEIAATAASPQLSKYICDGLANTVVSEMRSILGTSTVTITSRAVTGVKVGPDPWRAAAWGGLLGLVLSAGAVLLLLAVDTAVDDEQKLAARLQVPVLGSVPSIDGDRKAAR